MTQLDFKEWLTEQELDEGLFNWFNSQKKKILPAVAALGISGSGLRASADWSNPAPIPQVTSTYPQVKNFDFYKSIVNSKEYSQEEKETLLRNRGGGEKPGELGYGGGPQPDSNVLKSMPSKFKNIKDIDLSGFYYGKENIGRGEASADSDSLEDHIIGLYNHDYGEQDKQFPEWKCNAVLDFMDFVHGGNLSTQPALRQMVANKLGTPRGNYNEVAKELLEKYTQGKNIPPIDPNRGKGNYKHSEKHYSIGLNASENEADLSPYEILRHELDHHMQGAFQERKFGKSGKILSTIEFIGLGDAAIHVMLHQEIVARNMLKKQGFQNPKQNPVLYSKILSQVRNDKIYQQEITFPSGMKKTLGELGELARLGGIDLSKDKITINVNSLLAQNKTLINELIFSGGEKNHQKRNYANGITDNSDGAESGSASEKENPLSWTQPARGQNIPDWEKRMKYFGYEKVRNTGADNDWQRNHSLDKYIGHAPKLGQPIPND